MALINTEEDTNFHLTKSKERFRDDLSLSIWGVALLIWGNPPHIAGGIRGGGGEC